MSRTGQKPSDDKIQYLSKHASAVVLKLGNVPFLRGMKGL